MKKYFSTLTILFFLLGTISVLFGSDSEGEGESAEPADVVSAPVVTPPAAARVVVGEDLYASMNVDAARATAVSLMSRFLVDSGPFGHEKKDPWFFRLTTNSGRIIYVIGSDHPIPPNVLLHSRVFEILEGEILRDTSSTIFFHEHDNEEVKNYALSIHRTLGTASPWRIPSDMVPFWSHFEDTLIPRTVFRTGDLVFLPQNIANIIMARHFIPLRERIFGGFEHYFRQRIWKSKIQLESPEFVISALLKNPTHLKRLRILERWHRIHQYVTDESSRLLQNLFYVEAYSSSINSYNYDVKNNPEYVGSDAEDVTAPAMIARNIEWVKPLTPYLSSDMEDNCNLVIVCGADHLKGTVRRGSKGLLRLLFDTGHIRLIERFTVEPRWIRIVPN